MSSPTPTLIRRLSYLVSVRLVAMDWMTQRLLAGYLAEGIYYRKLSDYRAEYRKKRDLVLAALDGMRGLGVEYEKPKGGIYVWCRLPEGVDSKEFNAPRLTATVSACCRAMYFIRPETAARDRVRLNFSYEDAQAA